MPETTNNEFRIGLAIDPATGRMTEFCEGELDAGMAEEVAGRLLALAQAVRDEARSLFI